MRTARIVSIWTQNPPAGFLIRGLLNDAASIMLILLVSAAFEILFLTALEIQMMSWGFSPCESFGRYKLLTCKILSPSPSPDRVPLLHLPIGLPTSDLVSGSFSWQVPPNWAFGLINSVVKFPLVKIGLQGCVQGVAFPALGLWWNGFQCFSLTSVFLLFKPLSFVLTFVVSVTLAPLFC